MVSRSGEGDLHYGLQYALDLIRVGVAVLDRNGTVLSTNVAARRLIDGSDAIRLQEGKLIAVASPDEWHLTIARAVNPIGRRRRAVSFLRLDRQNTAQPYLCAVVPMGAHATAARRQAVAVVLLFDSELAERCDANVLQRVYGLSKAEAAVAEALLRTRSPQAAAKSLRLSMNTVRSHLKKIFEKTGTCRQADLLVALVTGPASLLVDEYGK